MAGGSGRERREKVERATSHGRRTGDEIGYTF
uniref:Uncharacterized protein n=1 Tax=Arundo donax TaxID=35708 RepID=A0A0A9B3Y1_ARUDO